jgi:peptide-methionine (S)-S-oxide reductase
MSVGSSGVFAAGCFWAVEAAFREIPGVTATSVGYAGGTTESPSYKQVCAGGTGHAEAVRVEYDPTKVSYDLLLDTFWRIHDPTTPNRQGWDVGTQYRSAIFFSDAQQQTAATASLQAEQAEHRDRIVTEIVPASAFYPAEEYHQRYLEKRGEASCHIGLKSELPAIDTGPKVQGGSSIWQRLLKTR